MRSCRSNGPGRRGRAIPNATAAEDLPPSGCGPRGGLSARSTSPTMDAPTIGAPTMGPGCPCRSSSPLAKPGDNRRLLPMLDQINIGGTHPASPHTRPEPPSGWSRLHTWQGSARSCIERGGQLPAEPTARRCSIGSKRLGQVNGMRRSRSDPIGGCNWAFSKLIGCAEGALPDGARTTRPTSQAAGVAMDNYTQRCG
jgi:hypothetical protein